MSKIKYSIVVPTFNNLESCLKPCIESLIQHTDANNSEIIIVANGCTDGTKDYLMTLDNHFKVIWCDKALGYTCATNAGIKHAVGDYVVLLNNDNVVFDRCWLSVLEQPFVFDPAVGITGPVKDKHAKTGVEFLLFFCAMIRRDVINKVGLLDEIFNPGYGEDIDYCAKIKEAGFKVVQVPSDDKRAADADNIGHVINFPLWHKGSQTVHKVEKWEEVVQRNEEILQKRYVKEKLEKKPKYSIIIPTYNHLDDCLKPCIDSLIKYTDLQDFEIIIVANGCTDGTREYVKSLPNNFKLIWEDVALGYPKAVNLGIKAVRGEYVIMLNNDVVLTHQPKNYWLMLLERPFVANPKVGITGAYKSVFALVDNNINSVFFKNQYIPFFCAMIKGSVVNEVGLLDEIFGLGYAEDVDYCIRIAEKGYEIVEVPYDIEYSLDDLSMEGCDKDLAMATHKIQFPILHAKSQTFSGLNLTINDNTSLIFAKYGKKKLASLISLRLNFLKRILLGVVDDKTTHEFLATKNYPSINKMIEVLSQNLDLSYVNGTIWPDGKAYTMIGLRRLDNLHYCLDRIRDGCIDGDVFEAGAWRGGACIFMAAYIKAYGMNKKVIVTDSFDGLPLLDTEKYPQDHAVSPMLFSDYLKVSLDQVRKNFADFGLLDDNIIFVQGKFSDTLRYNNKINKLSLLRFDADTYEATATVLDNVYYKLSTNGFCIIDDYFLSDLVKQATDNFREVNWIEKEILPIDNFGAFWQKEDPKFSIIIPTYNHVEDCLKPCVDSVLQNTNLANVEVIVVANGCVDGTKDYLQSLQNEVKQIWFEHALGYPKATNAGIDASKGQYIILLNNDVAILNFYPLNGWINCLYKACLQDKVGLAGPQKLFCDMLEFVFLCFFCVMIRREVIDKIGKIDEEFNNGYCDDNDFCYRALKAGYKYVQVPEDKDVHDESTSFPIYHKKAITFTNNKICAMHNCANQKQLLLKYANDASYIFNKYKSMHAYNLACVKYYHDVDVIFEHKKIYDCFLFYNELDLLEIRLNELADTVNYFVIVEATKTFTNKEKKLYFDDNKDRFSKFNHKIIHIIVDDMPNYGEGYDANWKREIYQRDCIKRGLTNCRGDDIVIISDVDEIPNKKSIKSYDRKFGICNLQMKMYYFFVNYRMVNLDWNNPKIMIFADMNENTCNEIRCLHQTHDLCTLSDGGWHFSYLGDYFNVVNKLASISHQEYNSDKFLNQERLLHKIANRQDIYDRGYVYDIDEIDARYPMFVQDNKQNLTDKNLICPQNLNLEYLQKTFIQKKRETTENKQVENKIKYSIVIPTFNHLEDCLKPCIASIKNFTDLSDCEIIIVANGCVDGTKEYLQTLEKPFKVIWHDQPLGYAKPVNLGMREAVGEYVILMNNDTELIGQEKNAWINMLLQPFMRDEKIAATGPLVLHDGYSDCLFVLSFCMMIKRSVLSEVGYMDETYGFGGGEDVDFCARLQSYGYKLAEVPDKPQFNGVFSHGGFPVYHKSNASRSDVAAIVDASKENNKNTSRNVIRHNKNIKVAIENKEPQDKTGYWSVGYDESCHLHLNPNLEGFLDDSVVEIYAGDYVDKLDNNEIMDIFAKWNEKLKADGKIKLTSQKLGNITIIKESTNNVQ